MIPGQLVQLQFKAIPCVYCLCKPWFFVHPAMGLCLSVGMKGDLSVPEVMTMEACNTELLALQFSMFSTGCFVLACS